jgi:hypothetical protein
LVVTDVYDPFGLGGDRGGAHVLNELPRELLGGGVVAVGA